MNLLCLGLGWQTEQKTCFDLRANLISIKVSASRLKSTQVHARPGQTESQVDPSFNLRLLGTPFGQGFRSCPHYKPEESANAAVAREKTF